MIRSLVICAAIALAAPVDAFQASNGLVVEPRGDSFFIPFRGKSGVRNFWCAAGEYAEKQLRQVPAAPLYRTSEPPRRSGEGIEFSLSPLRSATRTGLAVLGAQSGAVSIAHARSLCDTELLFGD